MEEKKAFRVGWVQIPVVLGDRKKNMETVEEWMKRYYTPGELTTALILPELWDTGYALDSVEKLADGEAAETTEFLSGLAKRYGCWFTGGSVMAKSGGKYYNRALIVNPQGELVTFYDKVHLVPFIAVGGGGGGGARGRARRGGVGGRK
ncbi:MAG: hypothetical protein LUH49_11910 [Cloacibacillus porcorum]|uniref:nitrilase-related carbon-nitrogen hydrolase n=1 Tax=Cloacibacillus porcorum TaxID=1197717 RepID=UPI0023F55E8B|nr:nitrilase-related carbon-nitrogen hydrolase [Cloacibacillus porcorum]MCD7877638.1 hypothetical protein [Cloacibacillus porcorum]